MEGLIMPWSFRPTRNFTLKSSATRAGRLAILLALVLAPLTAHAQAPQSEAQTPCCRVTAIDSTTGIVNARDAGGQMFSFKVRDSWRLKGLKVGQNVYADIQKKMVAIQAGDFCCEMVEIVTSPPRRADACGEPVQQRALSDTCAKQYVTLIEQYQLKRLYDQFQTVRGNLELDQGYYRGAIATCAIVDIGMVLLEYAAGKVATTPAKGVSAQQAKYLKEYGESLEKIRTGVPQIIERDPRVLLPDSVDKTFQGFDMVSSLFNAAKITPEKAAAKIEECRGKVPPDMYEHARRYVKNLGEMVRQAAKLAVYRNNLRAKGQECWDKQATYYKLCVDWARCKGTDPQRQCKAPGS
jgi:hypothetical protein